MGDTVIVGSLRAIVRAADPPGGGVHTARLKAIFPPPRGSGVALNTVMAGTRGEGLPNIREND